MFLNDLLRYYFKARQSFSKTVRRK